MFGTYVLETFIEPFGVKYHHVHVVFFIIVWFVTVVLVVVFDFQPIKIPHQIIAPLK